MGFADFGWTSVMDENDLRRRKLGQSSEHADSDLDWPVGSTIRGAEHDAAVRTRTRWLIGAAVLALGGAFVASVVGSHQQHPRETASAPVPGSHVDPTTSDAASISLPPETTRLEISKSRADLRPTRAPLPTLTGSTIGTIRMTSSTSAWIVTDRELSHTADAGSHWVHQPLLMMADGLGAGASFILDDQRAWTARSIRGDVIISRTIDGARSIASTRIRTSFVRAAPLAVVFVDAMNGFVSVDDGLSSLESTGRASLYQTSDGGESFRLVARTAPVPLAFVDRSIGWATADGLFVTTDGGATWKRVSPPGWDIATVTPSGPSYTIVVASPRETVIELYAPTGMEAQVRYLATKDLGSTWFSVAPPDSTEVAGTGPQSMLSATSTSELFGLQQGMSDDATLWISTNVVGKYRSIDLPFPALSLSMATPSAGLISTYSDVLLTEDGGSTWRKIAKLKTARVPH
jgi:photosystem II stability/assembly factor-like uncharacterized protein